MAHIRFSTRRVTVLSVLLIHMLALGCSNVISFPVESDARAEDASMPVDAHANERDGAPDSDKDSGVDAASDAHTSDTTLADASFSDTACAHGYHASTSGCEDINECANNNGGCDVRTSCTNTSGSYSCGACPQGFSGAGRTGCNDIDECANNNGGCAANVTCTNTPGSRICGACPSGYSGDGETCIDINECLTGNGGCDARTSCINMQGGVACGACPQGFTGTGRTGCADINECLVGNGGCAPNQNCSNTPGSFMCSTCPSGFTANGNGGCRDIDECLAGNACDARTTCTNTEGSFVCGACPQGFTGTGRPGCADINECSNNNGGCAANVTCTNTPGARTCGPCPSGYTGNGETCADVNECLVGNGGCGAGTCQNNLGSFACVCDEPNRVCSGTCSACPSDVNAEFFSCSVNSCVISACHSGFSVNAGGTACTSNIRAPFSGDPYFIAGDQLFGTSIALSADGNVLVVGNPDGGTPQDPDRKGAVTVLLRGDGTWSTRAVLPRPALAENFGASVAISGDGNTVVVGDPGGVLRTGAISIYIRRNGIWLSNFNASDVSGADEFGDKVAISADGNTVVVGDYNGGPNRAGTATIYRRSGNQWTMGIGPSTPGNAVEFGKRVGLSGDGSTLIVGDTAMLGNATVYRYTGSVWSITAQLSRFQYGAAIAANGNTIALGEPAGREISVYARTSDSWQLEFEQTGTTDDFGYAVALSGDGNTLVVGDYNGLENRDGVVHVYLRSNGTWQWTGRLTGDENTRDFGWGVALSEDGSTLAVYDPATITVGVFTR